MIHVYCVVVRVNHTSRSPKGLDRGLADIILLPRYYFFTRHIYTS